MAPAHKEIMKTIGLMFCFVVLAGCSTLKTLEPDGLPIEFTHMSHISQHALFTTTPTNYGYQAISIGARWQLLPHLYVVIEDGISLSKRIPNQDYYGALEGPREVFIGRISYEIPLK